MNQVSSPAPELTDAQLVALEWADTLMAYPAGVTPELRLRLHRHFTRDQVIELSLDVMKWSYQKVAVALGVDAEIEPGRLTDLVFDAQGNWVRPAAR